MLFDSSACDPAVLDTGLEQAQQDRALDMRIPRGARLSHSFWARKAVERQPSLPYSSQSGEDEHANAHKVCGCSLVTPW